MKEYQFADIFTGLTESFSIKITTEMEDSFREITGDQNPLHKDDIFAQGIGEKEFLRHVSFGMLTASFYSTLAGMYLPGKFSLIHSLDIKFQMPVYTGDTLTVSGSVANTNAALKLLEIKAKIVNQDNKCVSKANMKVLVLK